MFPAAHRLRTTKHIRSVFAQGRKTYHPLVRLLVLPTKGTHSRAAVIVSKRVSNKAVLRNRIQRQLRELLWEKMQLMEGTYDIVLIAQPKSGRANWNQLSEAVETVFSKQTK